MIRFAIAGLVSVAMASSANAAAILQFQQQFTGDTPIVASNPNASTTVLSSTGTGAVPLNPPGWVPVFVGILGAPATQPAFMSFTAPLTSSTAASSAGGSIAQGGYTGTIQFNFTPTPNPASNILTITFTGGLLTGVAGGNQANFGASAPPSNVAFTSSIPALQAEIAASIGRNFALGLSGLTSPLALAGSTVAPFTGSIAGTFSTFVPEPSSYVMAGISALAGIGCLGFRRRSLAS
jgi:hypothetical protein